MAREGYEIDGARVGQAREAAGISQQTLADRCDLHRVTVTRIENGHARVSLEVAERLARELGCTREWIFGEPSSVDDFEQARERVATALSKIGEGFEDFTEAVDELYARVSQSRDSEAVAR